MANPRNGVAEKLSDRGVTTPPPARPPKSPKPETTQADTPSLAPAQPAEQAPKQARPTRTSSSKKSPGYVATSITLSDDAIAALENRGDQTLGEAIIAAVRATYATIKKSDRQAEGPQVDELGLPLPAPVRTTRGRVRPVSVRFTNQAHTALHRLADEAGLSLSEMVDQALTARP